ncbi:MAG TPA: hypothetical protein VFD91_03745 [Mariniphaga sp.]|nr:hypothetical protein [Mariniphaga sp.]
MEKHLVLFWLVVIYRLSRIRAGIYNELRYSSNEHRKVIHFNKSIFLLIFLLVIFSSCSTTLNFNHLEYDKKLEVYKYPIDINNSIVPRNENFQLIDSSNVDSFYVELETKGFRYNFDEILEKDKLKYDDFEIAKYYSEINKLIASDEFQSALSKLNQLEIIYPDVKKYSDYLFLKAITYEKLDSLDSAKKFYAQFLKYSSGKYSKRFRGYRDSDINDSIWGLERKYVNQKLTGYSIDDYHNFLSDIEPKFHYNSFQPGFLINPEDYSRGVKWITMFVFGLNYVDGFGVGYQVNRKIKSNIDINLWAMTSGNTLSFGGGVPIQIFKSSNNRFGLKLSPFFSLAHTDTILVENISYGVRQGVFNFGAKLSGGLYLLPKLSLGAYYRYNYHNANNPILTKKYDINIWWDNEYDLSIYYTISKGFSLKAGVYNGDVTGGISWSGWEAIYNFTDPEFIIRIDMY